MYTLRITDDNTVIATRETIMERSDYVDSIQIVANKLYKNQIDIGTDTDVHMKYVLPVSKKIKNTKLTVSNIDSDHGVIYYQIPASAYLTAEPGDIEVSFTFIKYETVDETKKAYVRKTQSGIIHITPLAQFDTFEPSEMLTEFDQRLVELGALARNIESLNQQIYSGMARDIKLDKDNRKVTLVNTDGSMGDGVETMALSKLIAEDLTGTDPDGTQDGIVNIDQIPNMQNLDILLK